MFSGFLLILAQPTPANPVPQPATQEQATARATILDSARIDFSRITAPRRPRADGLYVLNLE